MRFPVAGDLKSRDGQVDQDAKVVNGIVEPDGQVVRSRLRPGNSDLGLVRAGTAQGAYYFNGQIITVHGNVADRTALPLANNSIGSVNTARAVTSAAVRAAYNISVYAAGTSTATATSPSFHGLRVGDSFTIAAAADAVYNGTFTVATVVSDYAWTYTIPGTSGNDDPATVSTPSIVLLTTTAAHGFRDGQQVTVAGASPADYNGVVTIRWISATSFIYVFPSGSAPHTTPATGTITATSYPTSTKWNFADNTLTLAATGFLLMQGQSEAHRLRSDWNFSAFISSGYPGQTVPGCVFLDGYFFVMDPDGVIWNSNLDSDPGDATKWVATSFVKANKESGAAVALIRSLDFIAALKEHSTEVFYDAGNPAPGSPLSPVEQAFTLTGCASAASVAKVEGSFAFISQSRSKGRAVHLMTGSTQQRVSTPDIERILDADDLATVYAFGVKLQGHVLYVLTLVTSNITLVYDVTAQTWTQWSSLTAQSPASISSITRSDSVVTVTFAAAHNLADGDALLIAGATPSTYNGLWQVSYVSTTVVTFEVSSTPTTPATGTITGTRYVESYFKFSHYVNAGGRDILLHESDGHLYEILSSQNQDNGAPIRHFTRSSRMDGGDTKNKRMPRLVVIADSVSDHLMIRWSDDDCQTFNSYRRVDLSLDRPRLRRCGPFRRRTVETLFVGNNPLRVEALELEANE